MSPRARNTLIAASAVLAVTASVSPAIAQSDADVIQFASGARLLTACEAYLKDGMRSATGATCFDRMWPIVASIASVELMHETLGDPRAVCMPERFTADQAAVIFVSYATDHPENLDIKAELLFIAALRELFPCPR